MESEEGGGGVFSPGGRTELVDGAGETRSGEPGVSFFLVFLLRVCRTGVRVDVKTDHL